MPATKEDLENAIRRWASAYDNHDNRTIAAMEAGEVGFGFRSADWRDRSQVDEKEYAAFLERFFSSMVYYRLELEDLHTSIKGEIGFVWGVFLEDFQEHGHAPERVTVRFSSTLMNETRGWRILSFHRDIQPFDADGGYPRYLTYVTNDD